VDTVLLETSLLGLVAGGRWEQRLGGLHGAAAFVGQSGAAQPSVAFLGSLRDAALGLLEDAEVTEVWEHGATCVWWKGAKTT
jgi:hypothetical protein